MSNIVVHICTAGSMCNILRGILHTCLIHMYGYIYVPIHSKRVKEQAW